MNTSYDPDPAHPSSESNDARADKQSPLEQSSTINYEPETHTAEYYAETARDREDALRTPPMSLQHAPSSDDHAEDYDPEAERSHPSVRDTLTRIPEALGALGQNLRGTFERAINSRDDYVVAVKVSPEAQHKLEQLVEAGVFQSRAEAASYLIDEGIRAHAPLFERVTQKLTEIEKLQSELRGMVEQPPQK